MDINLIFIIFSDEIVRVTKNDKVSVKKLDLSSQSSIREFAADINKTCTRLDVLIHNAGTAEWNITKTEDDVETTMATNHFGPFLLTHLLIGNKYLLFIKDDKYNKTINNPFNYIVVIDYSKNYNYC